jgi:hypothetical protein
MIYEYKCSVCGFLRVFITDIEKPKISDIKCPTWGCGRSRMKYLGDIEVEIIEEEEKEIENNTIIVEKEKGKPFFAKRKKFT